MQNAGNFLKWEKNQKKKRILGFYNNIRSYALRKKKKRKSLKQHVINKIYRGEGDANLEREESEVVSLKGSDRVMFKKKKEKKNNKCYIFLQPFEGGDYRRLSCRCVIYRRMLL